MASAAPMPSTAIERITFQAGDSAALRSCSTSTRHGSSAGAAALPRSALAAK